jgi:nitrate reductase NapE component
MVIGFVLFKKQKKKKKTRRRRRKIIQFFVRHLWLVPSLYILLSFVFVGTQGSWILFFLANLRKLFIAKFRPI